MAEVNKSKRDKLRSLTVGGNKTFSKHIVEYGGEQFEFRTPTVGTFRRIRNLATVDGEADEAAIVIWELFIFVMSLVPMSGFLTMLILTIL